MFHANMHWYWGKQAPRNNSVTDIFFFKKMDLFFLAYTLILNVIQTLICQMPNELRSTWINLNIASVTVGNSLADFWLVWLIGKSDSPNLICRSDRIVRGSHPLPDQFSGTHAGYANVIWHSIKNYCSHFLGGTNYA